MSEKNLEIYQEKKQPRTLDFTLQIPIDSKLSMNSIYAGMHWGRRLKNVRKIHGEILNQLIANNVPKGEFENPVEINFCWNTLLDLDNHGYITKVIIDSLKGYLIHDDSKKYIKRILHEYWLGEGIKIKIVEIQ